MSNSLEELNKSLWRIKHTTWDSESDLRLLGVSLKKLNFDRQFIEDLEQAALLLEDARNVMTDLLDAWEVNIPTFADSFNESDCEEMMELGKSITEQLAFDEKWTRQSEVDFSLLQSAAIDLSENWADNLNMREVIADTIYEGCLDSLEEKGLYRRR